MRLAPVWLCLSGCYPYLPGTFDDYVDTDVDTADVDTFDIDTSDVDTQDPDTDPVVTDGPVLIGWANWGEYRGTYWSGVTDGDYTTLNIVFGLTDPSSDWDYVDLRPSGCGPTRNSVGEGLVDDVLDYGGSSRLTVSTGATEYFANRDASLPLWAFQQEGFGLPHNQAGTLELDLGADGTVEGTGFRTPSSFTVVSPNIGGSTASRVPSSGFTVSWSGTLSDDMVVDLQLVDGNGNPASAYQCVGRSINGSGSVTFNRSNAPAMSAGMIGVLTVGRVRRLDATIAGTADATTRMVSVFGQVGAIVFE